MTAVECAGCLRPIKDRFLLKVLDKDWHPSCVRCQLCRKQLDEKCFYKEGKIYCKDRQSLTELMYAQEDLQAITGKGTRLVRSRPLNERVKERVKHGREEKKEE